MTETSEAHQDGVSATDEPKPEPQNLFEFLQASPLAEAIASGEFVLPERERDSGREIDLSWAEPDA